MIRPLTNKLAREFGLDPSRPIVSKPSTPRTISTASLSSTEELASKVKANERPSESNDDSRDYVSKEAQSSSSTDAVETPFLNNSNAKYAGDEEDHSEPLAQADEIFKQLQFNNPADLAAFYDDGISSGEVTLYPWQLGISDELAASKANKLHPFKKVICAANGSGKDAFVITPFAVWFALTKIKSRCIITSSSGVQLTAQTETYIANLCRKVNEVHGEEIFKIRQRFIKCRLTGSEIRLFATDEEGKAEGYHPIEPSSEMAIIINEAKSVRPEIYRALRRCTGYNYWLEVSTPGSPTGDFYKHFTKWPTSQRISYKDCPNHLSEDERLADLEDLGESSMLYRSKWLALFTSIDTDCIITLESVNHCLELIKSKNLLPTHQEWPLRVGLDIAAGGAETSIKACKGNRIVYRYDFREKDTTVAATLIDRFFTETLRLSKSHDYIFGDDGGIGKGVIDQLNSNHGWSIKRVNNQSPSSDRKRYINRGAENWFKTKRIIEEGLWYFTKEDEEDTKFIEQLTDRRYKQQSTQGRIALEAKKDAMSNGRLSPDRADAFVLCFTDLSISDFKGSAGLTSLNVSTGDHKPNIIVGHDTVAQWYEDNITFGDYEKPQRKSSRFDGRISTLVSRQCSSHNKISTPYAR